MTNKVAVLVPVLKRPHRVKPLVKSISTGTPEPHSILFICDPDDRETQDQVALAGCRMISPGGTYAQKINAGVRATTEPLLLFAADDVEAHRGWLTAAVRYIEQGAQVVGLNDLIERAERPAHATHFLVTRAYAEQPCIDGSTGPTFEGYGHWRVDDELIATAQKRGVYAYAPDAVLQHFHPMTGTAPDDDTYRKGRSTARSDNRIFARRSRLWT